MAGGEVNISGLENSETESSIRDETRALLNEAKAIVEMSKGTEKEEDFTREYAELANEFNTRFEDGIIDDEDLGALKNELDEVRLAREIGDDEREFFDRISNTNDKIIEGGEPALLKELEYYKKKLNSFGILTALTKEEKTDFLNKIDTLEGNSSENIYNRLFDLSSFIHELTGTLLNTTTGSIAMRTYYSGDFEAAHNYNTREIIRKAIENNDSNETIVVGYTEAKGYYTTSIENIDISNNMEVGTFLCSLNKSGQLTKENLLKPNGPFSPTDLFDLNNKYKSGAFGGADIQGLFIGYLDGFENNMELVAIDYLANEQNGSHIVNFFNAQSATENTSPLYSPEDIIRLGEDTINTDISSLKNKELYDILIQYRVGKNVDTVVGSLSEIYENTPEIMEMLRTLTRSSLEGNGNVASYSGVNKFISEYNQIHETDYPLIQGDLLHIIESTLTSIRESEDLEQNLEAQTQELNRIKNTAQRTIDEISMLRTNLRNEIDFEKSQRIREEINRLQMRNFMLQQEIAETEVETINAEVALDENSQSAKESINKLSSFIESHQERLQERHENIQLVSQELISPTALPEERQAFTDALEVYFHEYTFEEILERPSVRLAKITDKAILIDLLTQYNSDEKLILTNFKNLPASLRNDKEVALAYPGKIDETDFPFMHPSLLRDPNFVRAVITKSLNREEEGVGANIENLGLLLQRYCASGGDTREMVDILVTMFETYPDLKNKIKKYIPYSIIQSDNNKVLDLGLGELEFTEKAILDTLTGLGEVQSPRDFENRFLPAFQKADSFLEQNPSNEEIKLLLIEKGGLSKTAYLKGNLGSDRSSVTWSHILEHDIHSIKYLEEGTRKNPYFQQKFVDALPDYTVNSQSGKLQLGYLLEYIPLESPQDIFTFMNILKDKFPEQLLGEDGNLTPQIYTYIGSNEKFKNVITGYFEIHGVDGLDQDLKYFISTCIFSSAGLIGQTTEAINAFQEKNIDNNYGTAFRTKLLEDFPELEEETSDGRSTKIEVVMNILQSTSIANINEGDGVKLAEIFGKNFPNFINICKTHEISVADDRRSDFADTPVTGNEYSQEFHKFFTLNEEGEYLPNIETIDSILVPEIIAGLRLSSITNPYQQQSFSTQYLQEKYGLNIEQAEKWYVDFLKPSIQRELLKNIDPEDYADALESGNGDEYIGRLQEKIGNKAVLRIYPNAVIDSKGNISIPSQSQQNIASSQLGLDTRDTYREISTELMLTQEEKDSLTPQELEAIASDEKIRESFIGFRSTLVELGLTELWKFRNDIFKAIGSLDLSISDGDYVGENELNIFLAKTVYATTGEEKLKNTPSNLESTKQLIRVLNNQTGGPNDIDAVNTVGDALTKVENSFRNKFAPRNSGVISFNVGAFHKALRK